MPSQAGGKKRRAVSHRDQGDCTKILVRNLPFQATRKELRQLFVTFGELRSLRVPKKVSVCVCVNRVNACLICRSVWVRIIADSVSWITRVVRMRVARLKRLFIRRICTDDD
jgi:RNA recognition motif-containing protein